MKLVRYGPAGREKPGLIDGGGVLRDLSRKGALLECPQVPNVGSAVVFIRGETVVNARVAWAAGNRVGIS